MFLGTLIEAPIVGHREAITKYYHWRRAYLGPTSPHSTWDPTFKHLCYTYFGLSRLLLAEACGPFKVSPFNWRTIFEWYMAPSWLVLKTWHYKYMRKDKIKLCVQNTNLDILSLVVTTISRGMYDHLKRKNTFTLTSYNLCTCYSISY